MSENQVRNHLGSKWTTEEYIQWNVMIEVTIEVMIIYRLLHDYKISRDNSIHLNQCNTEIQNSWIISQMQFKKYQNKKV